MSVDRRRGMGVAVSTLALLLNAALGASVVRAQATAPASAPPAGYSPLAPALQSTLQTGRPTVVIVTSRSEAASISLRDALPGLLQTQPVGHVALLAEMPMEQYAERVRALGVNQLPAVLVYGRNGAGMQLLAHRLGVADPYQVTGWLGSLGLERLVAAAPAQATADPTVQRTGGESYPSGQYPSQQSPPPVYKSAPQPQPVYAPQPQPVYAPQPQPVAVPYTPTYAAPAPAPVVVAPPTQPVLVAPPAQTIMVAPAPPPNIVFSAPTQPTVMMAPTVASAPPAAAPTNAFLAPAQPPVAMAPAPVAMAPPAAPVAMAPVGQAPQVGQGPVTAAFLTLVAPTLIERILGAIGQRLAEKGQPRLSVGQSPTISAMAMAPGMGQAPVAMMAPQAPQAPPGYQLVPAYPYQGPPPGYGAPPPNYGYAPPAEPYVPPNAPSPQSYRTARAPSKQGW